MLQIKDKKIWLIIFLYGLCAVLFHMFFMEVGTGDDRYFMTCLNDRTLGEYYAHRWNTWSSRLIIETVLVLVLKQPVWLWKILDIAMSCALAYLLFGVLFHKKEAGKTAVVCGLFLILYDFREMSSAGYMTTTIFYWWVLVAAIVAFLPIYFHYKREKISPWLYVLAVPCGIFAANQEQVAIIFVCTCIYMMGVYFFEKRKLPLYLCLLLLTALVCLSIVFVCPGNAVRMKLSIEYWFPNYADFRILQKGLLGWYGLLRTLFQDINWLFTALTGILFWAAVKKKTKWYEKLIAAVPLFTNTALAICLAIAKVHDVGIVNEVVHAFDLERSIVCYQGSLPDELRLLMLAYTVVCLCVIFTMHILWGSTKKFSHLLAVLVIGSASKVSMGMSPTVWASSERTSIFLMFALIIIATYCAELIFETTHQ